MAIDKWQIANGKGSLDYRPYAVSYKPERYAYAVGRIRALEEKLLKKGAIERLVEANSPGDSLKVLSEIENYREAISRIGDPGDFEVILTEEIKELYSLIAELTQDPGLTDLFSLRYDFHNLKAILKHRFALIKETQINPVRNFAILVSHNGISNGVNTDGKIGENHLPLINLGKVEPERLRVAIKKRDFRGLPDWIEESVGRVTSELEKNLDPQLIDIILDACMYDYVFSVVASKGNIFLLYYFRISIDLANIKTFLRIRNLKAPEELLSKGLIDDGFLSRRIFLDQYGESLDVFVAKLRSTPYEEVVKEAIEYWQERRRFLRLEKLFDDYIMDFVKRAKRLTVGVEPLIGYLLAKENEVQIIRTVLIGKLNNLSEGVIREGLRDSYV